MRVVRIIPLNKVKQAILNNLEQFGFTLIYTATSIKVLASV